MEFSQKDANTPLLSATDERVVKQSNQGVSKVVSDLKDLQDIAKDINRIVHEDQQFFDESEKNLREADENVESGITEITLASEYNASYRKKICIIVTIVTIVLIVVIILILWGAGVFKKKKKT